MHVVAGSGTEGGPEPGRPAPAPLRAGAGAGHWMPSSVQAAAYSGVQICSAV
jgi:hypothetical protein